MHFQDLLLTTLHDMQNTQKTNIHTHNASTIIIFTPPMYMYNVLILFHIHMKQLLLQITHKFTKNTYSQYQHVSSDQIAQTTRPMFMSNFLIDK